MLLTPALNFSELTSNNSALKSAANFPLIASGDAGLPLASAVNFQDLLVGMQGRVIPSRVVLRSQPSAYAPMVSEYFENMIL
ncbi:MAG TPA: hypothetical protein VLQ47_06300, partial [Rhodoferax sp.]|nr:hypothetical protein [Rhodoferax sp.]